MQLQEVRWRYYLYSLTETQGLIAPVWVLVLQARGLSYTDIGFLGALYWAVLVLAEIPTGISVIESADGGVCSSLHS